MKHVEPKHSKQNCALRDIRYLHDALHDIHRGTDGDGVPTYWLANAIGFDADGWTEKSNHPDIKEAIEAVDWFLYNKGGKEWAENCGPLKPAFRAVLREIKKRLEETDWSPCRCKRCTEYRRKNAIKQSPES